MSLLQAIQWHKPVGDLKLLVEKTTDFTTCLTWAIVGNYPLEFIEFLAERTTDFWACLYVALERDHTLKFLEFLAERTTDFNGCLYKAIGKGLPTEFVTNIAGKTTDFKDCLYWAILRGYPLTFLDILLEKGGVVDLKGKSHPVPPGYEKYCKPLPVFVKNTECFVCLLEFDETTTVEEALTCGHLVHKGCNLLPFRCPYH